MRSYCTDFVKNEDRESLLEFISERDTTVKAIEKRNKLMRRAYVAAIAVGAFFTAYIGVIAHIF